MKNSKKNSLLKWALVDQMMVSGSNFIFGILVARKLGLEMFGVYTILSIVILFLGAFQKSLIIMPLMSLAPKQKSSLLASYYGAVTVHQAVFIAIIVLIIIIAELLWYDTFVEWMGEAISYQFVGLVAFSQLQDFVRRYYYVTNRAKSAFISSLIRYLGQIFILCYFFFYESNWITLKNVIIIQLISALGGGVIGLKCMPELNFNKTIIKKTTIVHYLFSKWLLFNNILGIVKDQIFGLVAGVLLGPAAIGAWRSGQQIMGLAHILLSGLENMLPIEASKRYYAAGVKALNVYLWKYNIFGLVVIGMLSGFLVIRPDYLLELIYGREYSEYGFILRWYAVIYILIYVQFIFTIGLRSMENTKPIFIKGVVTGVFSLFISYPLINEYSLDGMLFGIFLIEALSVSMVFYYYRNTKKKLENLK